MPESFSDLGWGWLPAVLGALLVVIFVRFLVVALRRRGSWTTTEATVGKVRVREANASGTGGGIFASYHFTDASGQKQSGTTDRTFRKPKRNSTVLVRYDPENPEVNEEIMPLWAEVSIAVGGIAAGAVLVLLALGGIFS